MKTTTLGQLIIALFLAAVVLTGCGRAGDPLKPSEAARQQAKENKEPLPPRPTPNKEKPDKRFILDGLLE